MNVAVKSKSSTRDGRLSPAAGAAFIAWVTFVVYLPVLRAGYIWDDDTALTENPLIRSLSGLYDIWFSTKPYDYFPLTFTSFWLEWRLWGMNATGYHAVNVLLHALGAILFWRDDAHHAKLHDVIGWMEVLNTGNTVGVRAR